MNTISRRLLTGLGIVVFILLLFLLTAPASLISSQVEKQQNLVTLSGYQGRLMSGQVDQVFIKGLNYRQLGWDASTLGLLSGALKADLTLDDPKAKLKMSVDLSDESNWSFKALNGDMKLEPLTALSPIMQRLGLSGDIVFDNVAIAMNERLFTSAEGRLRWDSGNIRVSNMNFPLGDITADLSVVNDALLLTYQGTGSLQPGGEITLSPAGDYQMTLNVNPNGLPVNAQWLSQMGKVQDTGMVQFIMKGKVKL
jgi:hypothetical protein